MGIRKNADFTQGYGGIESPDTGYNEYTGSTGYRPDRRGKAERHAFFRIGQAVLMIVLIVLDVLLLLSFRDQYNWSAVYSMMPSAALVWPAALLLLCILSDAGENRALQLWFCSVTAGIFHYILSWAIDSSGWLALAVWLAAFFVTCGLFFLMDWRVQGRNAVPFACLLLPVLVMGFSFRNAASTVLPRFYYLVLFAVIGISMLNAAFATVVLIFGRKKK